MTCLLSMSCFRKVLPHFIGCLIAIAHASAQQFGPMMPVKDMRETGVAGRTVSGAGVVTCVEQHHFFIQDETGAIQVQFWNAQQAVGAGDLVVVTGVLVGYGGGLQIRGTDINRQGTRVLPEPETPKAAELFTGGARCQRVRVTGVVHDVTFMRGEVKLMVRSDRVPLSVCWHPMDAKTTRPDELLDAVVEVTGVAHSGAGPDGRTTGGRIAVATRDDVRVIKAGGTDIFQRPHRTLAILRTEVPEQDERFRVSGTVTYASPAGWFYFQDGTGTARGGRSPFLDAAPDLRRPVQANPDLQPGDVIELVGYVFQDTPGKVMPWLSQCEWRVLKHESPPAWEPVSAAGIFAGDYDGRPVSVSGEVVAKKVEKDREGYFNHTLTIDGDGVGFMALVQSRAEQEIPVNEGEYVRFDGVAMAIHKPGGAIGALRINLNSFADIHPASRPWNMRHLGRWLLLIAVLGGGAVIWIGLLRRQVRAQTAKLREVNDQLSRFKQIVETSTDFVAMATLENKPLYMNPAGRRILGIPLDADLSTIAFEDISTPKARKMMETGLPHAFAHGHWHTELNMRTLAGDEVPVSFLGLVIKSPDGKPQYISSIARDISERITLEQQLRQSNAELLRFKAIADNMNDLVAMADLDKKALYLNAAGRTMLGIGLDEDAASIRFDSIYTQESLELFEREGFAHAFEHGHWSAEVTMLHRNGSIVPVDFSGIVLRNPDGSPLCMSCIAHDLTHRLALENQLRGSLEHERELNALKSGFVNTISHEFRTPLGIILFASSMMRRFNQSFTADERSGQLDAIDEAVERMNELVEQALSLGRAEVAAPKKTTFDVRKFATRVIDEVTSATSRRAPISMESADDLPEGCCDETMLRTIIANLLSNAVKYSPAGSPISLSVVRNGAGMAVFTVRDHGRGLNPDDLPKLFTTFHRGKGVEGIPGSGLGLAIVKRCTEALGGSVIARNAPDGGAEFVVEIPLFTPPTS